MEKLVEVVNVFKDYPIKKDWLGRVVEKLPALRGVSLTVEKGKTLGVVGESGCGKSTLAKIILDLERPTKGLVKYKGKDISKLRGKEYKTYRLNVQAVFQNPQQSLNPKMRCWEIVTEGLKINFSFSKRELIERAGELLSLVGLPHSYLNSYPHQLSGGQKQRLAIARALALNPELIVADEATSALDVSVQAQVINLFLELQERFGIAYFFISHSLPVVEAVSDEIAVIYKGYLVEFGKTEEVISEPLHPYTKLLISSTPVPNPAIKKEKFVWKNEEKEESEKGCPFYFRCPFRRKDCLDFPMELKTVKGRKVACILY